MTRPQRDPTARCKPQVKEIPFSQLMSCRGRRGYWTGRKSLWERRGRTLGRAPAADGGMCIAGSRTWHITARFRGVLCLPVDCGLDAGGSPVHAAAQCTRHAARASRKKRPVFWPVLRVLECERAAFTGTWRSALRPFRRAHCLVGQRRACLVVHTADLSGHTFGCVEQACFTNAARHFA